MKTPILIVVFSIFCVKNILAQNTTIVKGVLNIQDFFQPSNDHSGALSNRGAFSFFI
jgi:hypothetical protein